jgi:hypothetical protein
MLFPGSGQQKRMVLLLSANTDSATACIEAGFVIKVPTTALISKMDSCFILTDKTAHEFGFVVGVNDSISLLVKGKSKAIKKKHRQKYFDDLVAKGDTPAFDVHSHPKHEVNIDDTSHFHGLAKASWADQQSYFLRSFDTSWKYSQPSVILAYEADSTRTNEQGRFVDVVPLIPYIGFYTIKDSSIFCLRYDSFAIAVNKINPSNQPVRQETIVYRPQGRLPKNH